MSNPYVTAEIEKIVKTETSEFPLNMAFAASWILAHFKAINIKVYNASGTSSLADYNIIASMQNPTQAKASVDTLLEQLKDHGMNNLSLEGRIDAEWILADFGDVIIHIFQETSRAVFDLDHLWRDVPQVKIPEEFYFSEKAEVEEAPAAGPAGYF
jgi:ribosome-associated protein